MADPFLLLKDYLYNIYDHNPYVALLQMSVVELAEGTATLAMPVADNKHTNLYNVAHGGALASLADTAMGVACATTGKKVLTLDMNMNFISSAKPQEAISAVARVIHNGTHTMVAETNIVDGMSKLLLTARGTFFVVGKFLQED